jgi:hypothetical protein
MNRLILASVLALSISTVWGQDTRVVEVRNISADYAAASPTVTFEVYWNTAPTPPRHRDTVWVFVDYQPIAANGSLGAWTPATPTNPSVTGGAIVGGSLNGRGFYLDGDGTGAFSSTVTVPLAGLSSGDRFNWCAYVTDYPPNATIGAGAYDLHGTSPFVVNGASLGAGVRTYTGCITALTDLTGCPGIIPEQPAITSFTASTNTLCLGDSVTLTVAATGATEYSYDGGLTWTPSPDTSVAPTATTTYTLSVNTASGCSATYSSASPVSDNPLPTIGVQATPPAICYGDTSKLSVTSNIATSYSYDGGLTWTTAADTSVAPTADATYVIYVKTAIGCMAAAAPVSITVYPRPVPAFVNPPSTYCADSAFTIKATGGKFYCFQQIWVGVSHNPYLTGNDSPATADCEYPELPCTFTADSAFTVHMPESGSVVVWVKVMSEHGCVNSTNTTIVVDYPPATPVLSATGDTMCAGSEITLTATAGAASYSFNNGAWQTDNIMTLTVTANSTFTVKAASASGCESAEASKEVAVSICCTNCGLWATCNFSLISNVSYENSTLMNGSSADTYCKNKDAGWRLPTLDELRCICQNKSSLPGGYERDAYYWSSEPVSSGQHHALYFDADNIYTCQNGSSHDGANRNVKCVK